MTRYVSNDPFSDPIRAYLQAIGRYPLLTPEQEIEHARNIRAFLDNPKATKSQKLIYRRSKKKLVLHNLRLCVNIAKKHLPKSEPQIFLDLIQEGTLGLERAADKFDPAEGCKFSTYAYWWIKQAITRYLAGYQSVIRLPNHVSEDYQKIRRFYKETQLEKGREPSIGEIAKATGFEPEKIKLTLATYRPIHSIDRPIREGEAETISSLLPDETYTPVAELDLEISRSELRKMIEKLPDTIQAILKMSYGFDCDREYSLKEISDILQCEKEWARRLKAKGMRQLRSVPNARKLAELKEAIL